MSTALREIRRRIRSARQIHKVTSALQRVSAARLARDRRVIEGMQRYTGELGETLRQVIEAAPRIEHPLLRHRVPVRRGVAVIFGSDRGLCGGFNADLLDAFGRLQAGGRGMEWSPVTVGAIVERRLRRQGRVPATAFAQPAVPERAPLVAALSSRIVELYGTGECDAVYLVFARFGTALQYATASERVLPAAPPAGAAAAGDPLFEPSPRDLLERLLPEYVRARVDAAFLNSAGAESAARQVAMSRASRNAQDMVGELVVQYFRARQEGITSEMIELVAGGGSD